MPRAAKAAGPARTGSQSQEHNHRAALIHSRVAECSAARVSGGTSAGPRHARTKELVDRRSAAGEGQRNLRYEGEAATSEKAVALTKQLLHSVDAAHDLELLGPIEADHAHQHELLQQTFGLAAVNH